MFKHRKTLLLSGLVTASILTSLAIGFAIGNAQLFAASGQDAEDTRENLLAKLEASASQDAQAATAQSFFGPSFPRFGSSSFGDPFARLQQMQAKMESLFAGSLASNASGTPAFGSVLSAPKPPQVDVQESDEEYRVVISLEQDSALELQTNLEGKRLSISAQLHSTTQDDSAGRQMSSSFRSQFSRNILLDEPVDATGMRTEKSASTVTIHIPKIS